MALSRTVIHGHNLQATCISQSAHQVQTIKQRCAFSLLTSTWLIVQSVAAEALTYACDHCHKDALQQKSRILQFLIPVQMLLGKLPSPAIRDKYNMHMYDTIIEVCFSPCCHDLWYSAWCTLPHQSRCALAHI